MIYSTIFIRKGFKGFRSFIFFNQIIHKSDKYLLVFFYNNSFPFLLKLITEILSLISKFMRFDNTFQHVLTD